MLKYYFYTPLLSAQCANLRKSHKNRHLNRKIDTGCKYNPATGNPASPFVLLFFISFIFTKFSMEMKPSQEIPR